MSWFAPRVPLKPAAQVLDEEARSLGGKLVSENRKCDPFEKI